MLQNTVLVMGDDLRSFLTIVRSLGSKGIEVDVCPLDHSSIALRSCYIKSIFSLPPYSYDAQDWLESFIRLLSQNHYDLIIPCSDQFIIPIMTHIDQLRGYRFAIPNKKAYNYFYDKFQTRKLAIDCNIPISPGRLLKESDDSNTLILEFGLPLVIKPRCSFSLDTLYSRNRVHVLKTKKDVELLLYQIRKHDDHLVEGYFLGKGAGISILAFGGEILLSFQHQRVHEPPDGGGSSYRKSVPLDPKLSEYVAALAKKADLTGVSMFEFKINSKTKNAVLVEVNARFWGSLPLAVRAGIDFPYHLFRLLVNNEKPGNITYRTNYYGRNFTSDVYCLIRGIEASRSKRGFGIIFQLLKWCLGFTRILLGKEEIDSFSWRDPSPAFLEFLTLVKGLGLKILKLLPFNKFCISIVQCKRFLKAWETCRNKTRQIAIICSGNICRSPFAEHILRRCLDEIGISADVRSFGLIPLSGRRCPKNAIESARKFDVDLSNHISAYAKDDELLRADLILIFDNKNASGIRSRNLSKRQAVFKIGSLYGIGDISDPYGGESSEFIQSYEKIVYCVNKIVQLILKTITCK